MFNELDDRKHAFASLSLRDLLQARDLFHVHLMKKLNVVATAVGLYLIATDEESRRQPRCLDNSAVKPGFSWPSVLVFVDHYGAATCFDPQAHPDMYVLRSIYIPDGREVPICIVEAKREEFSSPEPEAQLGTLTYRSDFAGGGYPLPPISRAGSILRRSVAS